MQEKVLSIFVAEDLVTNLWPCYLLICVHLGKAGQWFGDFFSLIQIHVKLQFCNCIKISKYVIILPALLPNLPLNFYA